MTRSRFGGGEEIAGGRFRPDSEAGRAAQSQLAQVRQSQDGRPTSLLDITTDLGIPVVAAFSTRRDGSAFALGLGARTTQPEAACSAVFEMCQSELSLHVIAAKIRESGQASLNESDLRQLARATTLDTQGCLLLQPLEASAPPRPLLGNPFAGH